MSNLEQVAGYIKQSVTPKVAIAAAATAAVAAAAAVASYRSHKLPPGPIGVPFLGRVPWIDVEHFEESLLQMREKYGTIFSFKAGELLMIVVSSYEELKEMMKMEEFAGRVFPPDMTRLSDNCGMAMIEGQKWREQRRLVLKFLRDLGFGKVETLQFIDEEVDTMTNVISKNSSECHAYAYFASLTNSVIGKFCFYKRYAYEDPRFEELSKNINEFFNDSFSSSASLLFPTFRRFMSQSTSETATTATLKMHEFLKTEIAAREAELGTDSHSEPLCLADLYIRKKRKAEANGDFETYKTYQLVRVILELFLAGTDTTARSLEWLMVHMSLFPHIQTKVQEELDEVVGRSRKVQLSDKDGLQFTQAVIDESMRFASLAFNSVLHRALDDAEFGGYKIPSKAAIVPFLFGMHRDASVWEKPNEFYPEHFLDKDRKYTPSKFLMPFGIGKRICPGESVAKLEIFYAFTAIMQRFTVSLADSCRDKREEILRGITTTIRQTIADCKFNFHER